MIVVDKEKCSGCGLCAQICHQHCITLSAGNGQQVEHIDHSICSTCTQCIAVCPRQALTWNHVAPEKYNKAFLPSARQVGELLKQRRTIRHFKDKSVDGELMEEIVQTGIYAPTNNYNLRAIILSSPDTILEIDTIIMNFVRALYNICYKSDLMFNICRRLSRKIDMRSRVKVARGIEQGHTYGSLYAASIFIVGDNRILLSQASAQYALYNMILYAQLKGLGSRIQTGGALTLNNSRKARKILGLNKHESILAMLELGYPAIRFSNKAHGKQLPITWLESSENG